MTEPSAAAALLSKYRSSTERLNRSAFQRPLFLESVQSNNQLKGEVYALMDQPLASLSTTLTRPTDWCELLLLHPNVAQCKSRAATTAASSLLLQLGSRLDPSLKGSYPLNFGFHVTQNNSSYLELQLNADKGPLGTGDYRILFSAVPVAEGKTFVHLAYSYSYGVAAKLAATGYLVTKGRGKVGFTVMATGIDGKPKYVDGLRGIVERNVMRYYLAIDAYLGAKATSGPQRFEQSLGSWFDAAEQFPRQLKEGERGEYLSVKRSEYLRQRAMP